MFYLRWKVPREFKEPQNIVLMIKDPVTWKKACTEELEEFIRQNLFSTIPRPIEHKVVRCKWVFKTKLDENRQIKCYKTQLVAQGFS